MCFQQMRVHKFKSRKMPTMLDRPLVFFFLAMHFVSRMLIARIRLKPNAILEAYGKVIRLLVPKISKCFVY